MEYAVELIELYWASLLVDGPVRQLHQCHGRRGCYRAKRSQKVLCRSQERRRKCDTSSAVPRAIVGEDIGPYVSQLLLLPADFGALAINQVYATLQPPLQYMTTTAAYVAAQNGVVPPYPAAGPAQPIQDGAGLAAYTHSDVLYQAYLIAHQVLAKAKHPGNPGIPYHTSATQKGFTTLGDPDAAALIGYVAAEALKAVWWQKWFVHLRHRPEVGGLLVHLQQTAGFDPTTPNAIVAGSTAVAQSAAANAGSFYLPQAFPEGSPTHPAYPTGHGTVAGACITVLKFFWDGNVPIPTAAVPNLPLNGELHKLASNVSFGHGIFAGIHWRSDTVESIKQGEKVALAIPRRPSADLQ